MSLIEKVDQIKEVYAGINSRDSIAAVAEVNKLLAQGWFILSIQQRGWDYTRQGEDSVTSTYYVLGRILK
jgi:hypothetical protein